MKFTFSRIWLSLTFVLPLHGFAGEQQLPQCLDSQKPIPILNEQVLVWKKTTPNQTTLRALVQGPIVQDFGARNDHEHFEIQIGPNATDTLEVVYNAHFGKIPPIKKDMVVAACGDYITSTEQTTRYPASPSGALIHWIHRNSRGGGHEHGYLMIDGVLYGNGSGLPVNPRGRTRNRAMTYNYESFAELYGALLGQDLAADAEEEEEVEALAP